ncbi:MAG: hypothetical protein SFU25_05095 [Candidatus Caenarcaniphilales bacterium]|nr:hypothetical protein [Candidatus Caenarcaniphilales bacterium]
MNSSASLKVASAKRKVYNSFVHGRKYRFPNDIFLPTQTVENANDPKALYIKAGSIATFDDLGGLSFEKGGSFNSTTPNELNSYVNLSFCGEELFNQAEEVRD